MRFLFGTNANDPLFWSSAIVDESKDVSRFRLDPKDFPGRIDVEVPEEVLAYLQRISDRTDRSISEIVAAMVVQGAKYLILSSLTFK